MVTLRFPVPFLLLSCLALFASAPPSGALSSKRLLTPLGEQAISRFGFAVSGAGDVNGDGYDDVVVGSYLHGGASSRGRAYVFLGGPTADDVPDVTMEGEGIGDQFGFAVAGIGDMNGDGFDDVIVGAPSNDTAGSGAGRAYVFLGAAAPNAVADLTLSGAVSETLGWSVAGAGDVNGDGFSDVIVNAVGAGRAYVFYGGASPNSVADLTYDGAGLGQDFARVVAAAGDVNGDGFDDLLASAPFADFGATDAGATYLYFGGPFAITNPSRIYLGEVGSLSGSSLAAGDLNNDGYSDIVIGGPGYDGSSLDIGRVYAYLGGPLGDSTADLVLDGRDIDDEFGISVAVAGDLNRDGFDDLAVGSRDGLLSAGTGRVDVYLGAAALNSSSDLAFSGEFGQDGFGTSVSGAGDVNGDGFGDLIAGAPSHVVGTQTGAAYVFAIFPYELLQPNGGESWVTREPAPVTWLGREPADVQLSTDGGFTWETVAAGVGGDFQNEIQVIGPFATEGARVRVVLSGATPRRSNSDESLGVFRIVDAIEPSAAAARLFMTPLAEAGNDAFGTPASAGDLNGDGFGDIIIGARGNDAPGASAGRAYVFFGGPSMDVIADLVLSGSAGEFLGAAVRCAGDVNGDGYDDVIVGAPLNDAGGADAGRAYVYFGGSIPDATADWILTGVAAQDQFGKPVASAGDVNGDGYDDVVVGAPQNDFNGTSSGSAYVFFGGVAPDGTADLTAHGAFANDEMGFSVGGGDLNGDGFDDVVVGAHRNDEGGDLAGRIDVLFGAATPDAVVDASYLGQSLDQLGVSMTVSDVNGDGFGDVAGGATRGGAGTGSTYVFYGGRVVDTTADLILRGEASGDFFGIQVAAGDPNADGFSDIFVGASGNDAGGTGAGRTYVYFGSPRPDTSPAFTLTGEAASDSFFQIVPAGDTRGDGFDDILVGAEGDDTVGDNAGKAYLYDVNRYHVLSPNGGETWDVGGTETISWLGSTPANVRLSVDGGATYELLETNTGGSVSNGVAVRVPHLPTRFARIEVVPSDPTVFGSDRSDSLFAVHADVTLFFLRTAAGDGGVELSWNTEPKVSSDGLAGYRLYRLNRGESGLGRRIGPALLAEAAYRDPDGRPGHSYRLTAVNGFGTEIEVGRVSFHAPFAGLRVWPLPARSGSPLHLAWFAPLGSLGFPASDLDVSVYDVAGRHVTTLAHGQLASEAGLVQLDWDLNDAQGREIGCGVYVISASAPSVGFSAREKVIVR